MDEFHSSKYRLDKVQADIDDINLDLKFARKAYNYVCYFKNMTFLQRLWWLLTGEVPGS